MKIRLKNTNGIPGPLAWILGGLSCIFLIGLCCLIFLGSVESSRLLAYRGLNQSILAKNWSGILQNYRQASTPVSLPEQALKQTVSAAFDLRFADPTAAEANFKIVNFLKTNNFTPAAVVFEGEKKAVAQFLQQNGGYSPENLNAEEFIESTDRLLDQQRITRIEITNATTALREISDEKAILLQRLEKISSDTADFFSLRPLPITMDSNGRLPVYTSGILENLPLLRGIPNGVLSAADLDAHVQKAFGKVKVDPGADAPLQFRRSITALRKAAGAVIHDWELSLEKEKEANTRLKHTFKSRNDSRDELERRFLWLIQHQLQDSGIFALRLKNYIYPLFSISHLG